MTVVGVDGASAGWVCVELRDRQLVGGRVRVLRDFAAVIGEHGVRAEVIAVDMPIGLTDDGERAAGRAARAFVGGRMRSTVFPAPPCWALDAPDYPAAARYDQPAPRASARRRWRRQQAGPTVVPYDRRVKVLDLFCGMGGLSLGFKDEGFDVAGFDKDRHAVATYSAMVGPAVKADLATFVPEDAATCIVGGPPCRPWSPINLQRRGGLHGDYRLVRAFDGIVLSKRPQVFVLENVPLLKGDTTYQDLVTALRAAYDVEEAVVSYADWGAATKRRRLFVIGVRDDLGVKADAVLAALDAQRTNPTTVRQAIERIDQGGARVDDHDWPEYRTIAKYEHKYVTHQYGWYRLVWDEPAPSFGNVAKTYTLHPEDRNGSGPRVVSPREVMALLGFGADFHFPLDMPRGAKYRMVADAVSPRFSRALAASIRQVALPDGA